MNRHIPLWGFALAFAVQAGLLGFMVAGRAALLANGQEIRLPVIPVDPRDFLRGDYVILAYPISSLPAANLEGDDAFEIGDTIFVELRQDGEIWKAVALHKTHPRSGVALRGKVTTNRLGNCTGDNCATYNVEYNLEKFFVPEGEGLELEQLRNGERMQVDVAVGEDGSSALKRLRVDGQVRYEESFY